jgi:hypothetical protein
MPSLYNATVAPIGEIFPLIEYSGIAHAPAVIPAISIKKPIKNDRFILHPLLFL